MGINAARLRRLGQGKPLLDARQIDFDAVQFRLILAAALFVFRAHADQHLLQLNNVVGAIFFTSLLLQLIQLLLRVAEVRFRFDFFVAQLLVALLQHLDRLLSPCGLAHRSFLLGHWLLPPLPGP